MLLIGGIRQFNITGNVTSQTANTASSTATLISTTCPTPLSSTSSTIVGTANCRTTVVGAAVGIPLGLLLLLSLALAFWERRKANAARMEKSSVEKLVLPVQSYVHTVREPFEMDTTAK